MAKNLMRFLMVFLLLVSALTLKGEAHPYSRASVDELYVNVSWCVWHEGIRIFDDNEQVSTGKPSQFRTVDQLRSDFLRVQSHNQHAQDLIKNTSNDSLLAVVQKITVTIDSEHKLKGNFRWVAYEKKMRDSFRNDLARNDFKSIRMTYFNYQTHNPNARNLLAAVSNDTLRTMVNTL